MACGARAAGGPGEDDEGEDGIGGTGSEPGGRGGRGGSAQTPVQEPEAPIISGDTPLPECGPGTVAQSAVSPDCQFVFGSSCYPSMLEACACACTRNGASRCIANGFLNPDAPQRVACTAL